MRRMNRIDPIRRVVRLDLPVAHAFDVFVNRLDEWWPPEYTWSGEVLEEIAIEPFEGGRCFERGPHGFTCDWGRVLVWEPPRRLVFTWQIAPTRVPQPNPDLASEVEVRFEPERNETCRIELDHRGFERQGNGALEYREGMNSAEGWTWMLERFAAVATETPLPAMR